MSKKQGLKMNKDVAKKLQTAIKDAVFDALIEAESNYSAYCDFLGNIDIFLFGNHITSIKSYTPPDKAVDEVLADGWAKEDPSGVRKMARYLRAVVEKLDKAIADRAMESGVAK